MTDKTAVDAILQSMYDSGLDDPLIEDAEDAHAAHLEWLKANGFAVVPSWQPIETAPRDGEVVLLHKPDERMVGEYTLAGYWGEWPGCPDGWTAAGGKPLGYFSNVTRTPQGFPTHWMPLPEPPQ